MSDEKINSPFFGVVFMLGKSNYGGATSILFLLVLMFIASSCSKDFNQSWTNTHDRIWTGPDFWANRLQDWQVADGRLECTESNPDKPMRTVHLLTQSLDRESENFSISVNTGLVSPDKNVAQDAATGFLIGAGPDLDYRAAAIVHHNAGPGGGLFAAIDGNGSLFIRDFTTMKKATQELIKEDKGSGEPKNVILNLNAQAQGDKYTLTLTVNEAESGKQTGSITLENVETEKLVGSIALVSHPGSSGNTAKFWFNNMKVAGQKIQSSDERQCGPVISTQHTLHNNILKMTAQLMPLGEKDNQTVQLQIKENGNWQKVATAEIIAPGWTAPLRVENWNSTIDVPYRVLYEMLGKDGSTEKFYYSGTVRRDPVDKEEIVVAGFTGNHNSREGIEWGQFPWNKNGMWFPHNDIVKSVRKHDPDVLFFSGDQVYEMASPTQKDGSGNYSSFIDYMYKWYLWCWAYGEMTKDIPVVCMTDDHDVYQGNIWGGGGRKTETDIYGGYVMPAEFIKMVERTQTSHLPDPYDPTPVEQGIGVYYTGMTYGRIGFSILEDRKFKSGITSIPPYKIGEGPEHMNDPNFDIKKADVPGLKLLGDRQLAFLKDWAADWRGQDMKMALSQTVFAGMATHHGEKLFRLIADLDCNGWPQTGRNKALHELRRGFAFMLSGDQHLGTIVHHGINDWNDAGYSFCVPSIANFYPRAWMPETAGKNLPEGAPSYMGEHKDGLGNLVTVYGVTNPPMITGVSTGREPLALHDNMPGYGIVKMNKTDRTITMECWPRYADPEKDEQYKDWPKTISQMDNYGRKAVAYLPTLEITGMGNPVVQVINESNNEVVYTLRIKGNSFSPKVFEESKYTIKIGDPEANNWKIFESVRTTKSKNDKKIDVQL